MTGVCETALSVEAAKPSRNEGFTVLALLQATLARVTTILVPALTVTSLTFVGGVSAEAQVYSYVCRLGCPKILNGRPARLQRMDRQSLPAVASVGAAPCATGLQ